MRRPARPARPVRLALACLTIGTVLVASGCSGEADLSADQEQAREVSRTFLEAVVAEDAEAACAVMAIQGVPVAADESWTEACVTGIEQSNNSPERLDAYARQLDEEPAVSAVKDDTVTVTWTAGEDVTTHTIVKIDGTWLLTQ